MARHTAKPVPPGYFIANIDEGFLAGRLETNSEGGVIALVPIKDRDGTARLFRYRYQAIAAVEGAAGLERNDSDITHSLADI